MKLDMRRRTRTAPARLRAALVCVIAFVALLVASVRPPALAIVHVDPEASAERHEHVAPLATSAAPALRVAGARPARGDTPMVGPVLVARAPSFLAPPTTTAADVRFPSPRVHRPRAKARAELMVFLN